MLTQTDSNFQIFKKRRRGEESEASKKNKRKRYKRGVRGEELFYGLLFMCGFN